VQAFQA